MWPLHGVACLLVGGRHVVHRGQATKGAGYPGLNSAATGARRRQRQARANARVLLRLSGARATLASHHSAMGSRGGRNGGGRRRPYVVCPCCQDESWIFVDRLKPGSRNEICLRCGGAWPEWAAQAAARGGKKGRGEDENKGGAGGRGGASGGGRKAET